jgi:hypothetical protein
MAGPVVSAEVAARLAEKYPHLADVAAGATVGDLVVSEKTEAFVNEHGVLAKRTVVLSRHRKYRMPDGKIVALDDVPEAPKAPVEQKTIGSLVNDEIGLLVPVSSAIDTEPPKKKAKTDK